MFLKLKHLATITMLVALCTQAQHDNPPSRPTPGAAFDVELPDKGGAITMLWCKPGTFTMGSPENEDGHRADEKQREVTISKGFWLSETEVTQAQWMAIKGLNQTQQLKRTNRFGELAGVGPGHPIYHVTYWEAMDFCKRLTDRERKAKRIPPGYVYRLPTEAQWEYACRAGSTTALNNKMNLSDKLKCPNLDQVAWFRGNVGGEKHPLGTQQVAQKKPNAWGFYDMHGNVGEWCFDKAVFDYELEILTTPHYVPEATNPVNHKGTEAVYRGGSWAFPATFCRSAARRCQPQRTRGSHVGFRVALVPGK